MIVVGKAISQRATLRAANLVRPDAFVFLTQRTWQIVDALKAIGAARPGCLDTSLAHSDRRKSSCGAAHELRPPAMHLARFHVEHDRAFRLSCERFP